MKRFLSMLISAVMLISTLPTFAFAEEAAAVDFTVAITSTNEKNRTGDNATDTHVGKTFTATPTVTSGEVDHFTYQWCRDWTKLPNETNQSYTPGNDALKYYPIRVYVKAYDANNKLLKEVEKNLAGTAFGRMTKRAAAVLAEGADKQQASTYPSTDDANVFVVDGKRFIILDDFVSDTETYYVLADDTYGTRAFDTGAASYAGIFFRQAATTYTSGDTTYTASSGSGNIAYWLNNDFLTTGNGEYKLPQDIINNAVPHQWHMAQNQHWKGYDSTAELETFKIALLGRADYYKYMDKFGAVVNGKTSDYWWLRDVQGINMGGTNGAAGPFVVMPWHNIVQGSDISFKNPLTEEMTTEAYVRPAFNLGKDFFTTVKLDVDSIGANVKALIAKKYTDEELSKLYTSLEIAKIKGEEVVISSLTITDAKHPLVEGNDNGSKTGRVLTASFDTTSGKADHYIYEWSTENGVLKTQKTNTVVVPNDEAYKNFTVKVTPVDADGNAVGETVTSTKWYVSSAINPPGRVKLASYTEGNGDWTFKVDGKTFALLEESSRTTDTFYVLAEDSYGKRVFDTKLPEGQDNSKTIFHPEEYTFTASDVSYTASSGEGNMAYWLNNDFLTNGNDGKKLPDAIISHLADHKYYSGATNQWTQNSATVKVALLGRHEFLAYQGKFSIGSTEEEYWWLRDTHGCWIETMATVHGPFAVQKATVNVVQGNADKAAEYNVRPSFWLDENFFKAVKLDVNSMGKEVKAVIADRYSTAELTAAGYNAKEIAIINGADEVVNAISDVAVSDAEGKTTVSYTYMADGSAAVEKVIVALYNGGVLAGAAIEDKTVTKGANPLTTQLDTAAYDEAKVFVWDMSTYEPKCANGSWEN